MQEEQTEKNIKEETLAVGNPELSLIGLRWYYYGENENSYYLHYDEIVDENEYGVFISINMDDIAQETASSAFPYLFFITYQEYYIMYPVSSMFPNGLYSDEDAMSILLEKCND